MLTRLLFSTSPSLGVPAVVRNQPAPSSWARAVTMGRVRSVPPGATVVNMATRKPFRSLRSFRCSGPDPSFFGMVDLPAGSGDRDGDLDLARPLAAPAVALG